MASVEVGTGDWRLSVQHVLLQIICPPPSSPHGHKAEFVEGIAGGRIAYVHADAKLHPCRPWLPVQSYRRVQLGNAALYAVLGYWYLLPAEGFTEHAANSQLCIRPVY